MFIDDYWLVIYGLSKKLYYVFYLSTEYYVGSTLI